MFAYKVANTGKHKETKKLGSSFRRKIFLSRIPLQTLFGEGASIHLTVTKLQTNICIFMI